MIKEIGKYPLILHYEIIKIHLDTDTVIWGITGHFLHFECVRKNYKGF